MAKVVQFGRPQATSVSKLVWGIRAVVVGVVIHFFPGLRIGRGWRGRRWLPFTDEQVVGDVGVGLRAAGIVLDVHLRRGIEHRPLRVRNVVRPVYNRKQGVTGWVEASFWALWTCCHCHRSHARPPCPPQTPYPTLAPYPETPTWPWTPYPKIPSTNPRPPPHPENPHPHPNLALSHDCCHMMVWCDHMVGAGRSAFTLSQRTAVEHFRLETFAKRRNPCGVGKQYNAGMASPHGQTNRHSKRTLSLWLNKKTYRRSPVPHNDPVRL